MRLCSLINQKFPFCPTDESTNRGSSMGLITAKNRPVTDSLLMTTETPEAGPGGMRKDEGVNLHQPLKPNRLSENSNSDPME
jgi:hypothetical protein